MCAVYVAEGELVALLQSYSCCRVTAFVLCLFLAVPWVVICDFGISWSYSFLSFFFQYLTRYRFSKGQRHVVHPT